jgi:hypothetical protein
MRRYLEKWEVEFKLTERERRQLKVTFKIATYLMKSL